MFALVIIAVTTALLLPNCESVKTIKLFNKGEKLAIDYGHLPSSLRYSFISTWYMINAEYGMRPTIDTTTANYTETNNDTTTALNNYTETNNNTTSFTTTTTPDSRIVAATTNGNMSNNTDITKHLYNDSSLYNSTKSDNDTDSNTTATTIATPQKSTIVKDFNGVPLTIIKNGVGNKEIIDHALTLNRKNSYYERYHSILIIKNATKYDTGTIYSGNSDSFNDEYLIKLYMKITPIKCRSRCYGDSVIVECFSYYCGYNNLYLVLHHRYYYETVQPVVTTRTDIGFDYDEEIIKDTFCDVESSYVMPPSPKSLLPNYISCYKISATWKFNKPPFNLNFVKIWFDNGESSVYYQDKDPIEYKAAECNAEPTTTQSPSTAVTNVTANVSTNVTTAKLITTTTTTATKQFNANIPSCPIWTKLKWWEFSPEEKKIVYPTLGVSGFVIVAVILGSIIRCWCQISKIRKTHKEMQPLNV